MAFSRLSTKTNLLSILFHCTANKRRSFLYLTLMLFLLTFGRVAFAAGEITFVEFQKQGVDGVDGLSGSVDPVVSPDGKHVYVASYASSAVAIFDRNASTGVLTYKAKIQDGVDGADGLFSAFSVAISPDGKHVYTGSPSDSGIGVFSRDSGTGLLTFVETQLTRDGNFTSAGFIMVEVSPDGNSVYGLGGSTDGLVVFSRDSSTGQLTFIEEHLDNAGSNLLGQAYSPAGSPINSIKITADGEYLYITSTDDNAVSVYDRNTTTGALIFSASYVDGVGGNDGLQGASSLVLSPNDDYLYVSGQAESAISVFSIDSGTGALTYIEKQVDETGGVTTLAGARSLAVSPDGRFIYASAITDSAITVFNRNLSTGELSLATSVTDGVDGVDGIATVSGMVTDPLNRHLYASGQGDQSVAVFRLPIPAVVLSVSARAATESGSAVTLDNGLEVLDSDDTNLESAQVSISSEFKSGDILAATTQGGILSNYDSSTGILSFTGTATLADYQATLRTVAFTAGSDADLDDGESLDKSISFTVNDGDNTSAASIITVSVSGVGGSADSDGNLAAAPGVAEPVSIATTVDTSGEAVDVFDFTLSDGGTSDGLTMAISEIVINVTGTSSDTQRAQITWRLDGNDVANVEGTYNAGADTITFSGLSISVADGDSEVYIINAYFNDNNSITHGDSIILALDGDTDLTVGASGTQMGATSVVNNGSGIVLQDDIAPVVTSVNVPANSTYAAAANLDFTVNFDENVTVNTGGGTPRLALTIGATGRFAGYISGSGTSALVFRETVVAGDQDLNGIALGATIDANSGTLRDSAGNNINTTLNSVGPLASVLVDALAPTVAEVTAVTTPGNDSTPDVTFSSNEAGTLSIGGSCGSASEGVIGSGNSTITLTQADNSTALAAGTYVDCTVIVTDSAGNANTAVTLTSFTVDLAVPTLAEVTPVTTPNNDTTPNVTFSTTEAGTLAVGGSCGSASEGAISSGNNTITLTQADNSTALSAGSYADCTLTVTDSVGNASSALTLTSFTIDTAAPTVAEVTPVVTPANDSTPNVTYSSNEAGTLAVGGSCGSASEGAISSGNNTITLTQTDNSTPLAAGTYADCTITVTDSAGNVSNVPTLTSFVVDLTAPAVAEVTPVTTPGNDSTPDVTFSSNEAGTLSIGGSCGSASEGVIGSGNSTITLTQADNSTPLVGGTYSDCTITVTDEAGNQNTPVTLTSFVVDMAAPTVSSVNVPANATYIVSQSLDFAVNYTESITVDTTGGTPQLALNIGGSTEQAAYISGSGTSALLFRYTVQTGDNDNDGIVVGTLSANGGILRDSATNDATLTLNSIGSTASVNVDALASTISNVSIPNAAHKVGDLVTATITVSSDSDNYTIGSGGISGTIAGYALASLSKTNDTTYTATFTITDGGSDVAAGSDIPVNFTLTDSRGNTSSAYTTAISQANDAVYANLPAIDLTASANTIVEDGGSSTLTATLSGSLNNLWPVDITVNLAYTGTATVTTDYIKSDSITITAGNSSAVATVTAVADTLFDAALSETIIVDIGSVSVGNEGSTNQQTISITDAEVAPTVTLSVGSTSIIEAVGTSTITATLSHPAYENVTVNLGYTGTAISGTDYSVPSTSIVIAGGSTTANATTGISSIDDTTSEDSETIIIDITSVTGGGAAENAVQQQTITLLDDDNVAPVITSTAITTVDEDVLYSYIFTVTDSNVGDTLVFSAPTLPSWLSFTANTGVLSGTPTNDEIGAHIVKLRVNDGSVDVDQDFTITVANTNDAPTITGTPITTAVEGVAYSFTVTGADVDVGDSMSYQLANQPTWLSVDSSGLVSGTPANSDVGTASNILVSVTDGTVATALPAFNIVVDADMDGDGIGNAVDTDIDGDGMSNEFETANGLDPLNPSDATGDIDGDGISNLDEFINGTDPTVDDYGPIITLDSIVTIDAVALKTSLPANLASANDALDGDVVVTHDLATERLVPGRYTINWSAVDAAGNVTTEVQALNVRPLANWQVDQQSNEGATLTVSLYLNGDAPEYPVTADYTVSGTATNPEDHNALSGTLTITEGRRGSITLDVVSDANSEADETINFELDSITNAVAGIKQEHVVTIGEVNHAPSLVLSAVLDSAPTKKLNLFSTADGMVTITATVSDVDQGDSHTLEWNDKNKLNGTASGNTYSFDPATVGKGVYRLTVIASDDDVTNQLSGSAVITLTILEEVPVLSNTADSDGDGQDDQTEGLGDSDDDNVPDFADNVEETNLLALYPIGGESSEGAWFVETQAGLNIKLNLLSSGTAKYSPLLTPEQIIDESGRDQSDGGYIFDGGIFDFTIYNLPVAGEQVMVVIPQIQAIPDNAVYRKFIDGRWSDYVENANNSIYSASGELGFCPPPGSSQYSAGLTEGHYCVQLGIEDGGVNDADDEVNGTILDPGGVGKGIPVSIRSSGGSISWPFLLLLSGLVFTLRRRSTNLLQNGV